MLNENTKSKVKQKKTLTNNRTGKSVAKRQRVAPLSETRGRKTLGTIPADSHNITLDGPNWLKVQALATQVTGLEKGVSELFRRVAKYGRVENGVLIVEAGNE